VEWNPVPDGWRRGFGIASTSSRFAKEVLAMPKPLETFSSFRNTESTTSAAGDAAAQPWREPERPGTGERDERFPHEKLDCYRLICEVVEAVAKARDRLHGLPGEAGPQLIRAVVRTKLGIAEAAGRQSMRDRARVFGIARGEACEAAAALEIAELFGAFSAAETAALRQRLVRVAQMLTKLARLG
jgi:four helix bundle protein